MARGRIVRGALGPIYVVDTGQRSSVAAGVYVVENSASSTTLSLAVTEAPDVAAITILDKDQLSLAVTEAPDVAIIAILDNDQLALAATEASDTLAATVTVVASGNSISLADGWTPEKAIRRNRRRVHQEAQRQEVDRQVREERERALLLTEFDQRHKAALRRASVRAERAAEMRALQDNDAATFLLMAA